MFVNDFQSSNEYRLQQVLHTLKSIHGMELELDGKTEDEIRGLGESSEIIKNGIIGESRFNTYNTNPEYTKHMLITEAVRLYLTEIAPKRSPKRKVREGTGDIGENAIPPANQSSNPAQSPKPGQTSNGNTSPQVGTVTLQKGNDKKTIPAAQLNSQLANLQRQGYSVIGNQVKEKSEKPMSRVIDDPKARTTTAYKIPGSEPDDTPLTPWEMLFGRKGSSKETEPEPVTPLPGFDKTQNAMPDMDDMVAREKGSSKGMASIPAGTGVGKAGIPVGSMPAKKIDSIPAGTGVGKTDTPVGSMPAADYHIVKKGENIYNILRAKGINPTPKAIKDFAKLNKIKNPNLIKAGMKLVFDEQASQDTSMDPALADLMKKYGVDELKRREDYAKKRNLDFSNRPYASEYKQKDDPRYQGIYKIKGPKGMLPEDDMEEGNEFSKALADARKAKRKEFTVGGETYTVTPAVSEGEYEGGDWGSSDWYPIMKRMDEYLGKHGINPDTIEEIAAQAAEFYHDMMGYEDPDDAKDRIISMWMTRRGWKKGMEEMEEDYSASKPNYDKLAREQKDAADAAFDAGDEDDFAKHTDLHSYYLIKSGKKPPEQVVDKERFMDYVEKTYVDHFTKLDESVQMGEAKFDHDNYQASMARSELYRNTKYAMDMLKMVKPEDEIQPWISANLTKSANYLDKIYHYMDYYKKFEPEQLPEDQDPDPVTRDMELGETTGSTARQNLMHIIEYSTKLFNMIQPGDKLEGWVAMKLTNASDAISSSKHYMDYVQFEKHASDMFDMDVMAEEGKNMNKKAVRESVGQMLMSMMLSEDQDLAQAQTLLAAKAMSDELQGMAEKVAKMSVEDLMPLVDTMKDQFGPELADGFNTVMKTGLEELLASTQKAKESTDNAIMQLQGGQVPGGTTDIESSDMEMPAPPEAPGAEDAEDDGLGGTDAASGPAEEPLGRAKKDESRAPRGKALNEKWGVEMKTKEKDKGMWDGWTVAELKAEKKKLMGKESRSAAEQKKVKQLTFAIRAKQKDKWGKVNESADQQIDEGSASSLARLIVALGLGAAAIGGWISSGGSAKDTPLGKALTAAAAKGDKHAAEELRHLDLYIEANDVNKIDGLRDSYLVPDPVNEAKKAKPDFRDFDGDGNTTEPMKKALRDKAKKNKVSESKLTEKAPPGKKAEDFIKGAKADFKERYGKDWEGKLYATAWKKFGTKSESYVKAVAMLEQTEANKARLQKAFDAHRAQYTRMVTEGKVDDPLNLGYGLDGEVMLGKMSGLDGMIAKLREMIGNEIRSGAIAMMAEDVRNTKIAKLESIRSATPYGVFWKDGSGSRKNRFFETEKLRKYWFDLNARDLKEHRMVNPADLDEQINRMRTGR